MDSRLLQLACEYSCHGENDFTVAGRQMFGHDSNLFGFVRKALRTGPVAAGFDMNERGRLFRLAVNFLQHDPISSCAPGISRI